MRLDAAETEVEIATFRRGPGECHAAQCDRLVCQVAEVPGEVHPLVGQHGDGPGRGGCAALGDRTGEALVGHGVGDHEGLAREASGPQSELVQRVAELLDGCREGGVLIARGLLVRGLDAFSGCVELPPPLDQFTT